MIATTDRSTDRSSDRTDGRTDGLTKMKRSSRRNHPLSDARANRAHPLAGIHHGHQTSTRTAEHLATIRQTIRRTP